MPNLTDKLDSLIKSIERETANSLEALAAERDGFKMRAEVAEAERDNLKFRLGRVINALDLNLAPIVPAEPAPDGEDEPLAPALDTDFLESEERAQRHFLLRHLNYKAPEPIDISDAINDAWGIGGIVMMSEERANLILDRLFAEYSSAMGNSDVLTHRIADFDVPDDFDWDAAIARLDAILEAGEPVPTFKGWDDDKPATPEPAPKPRRRRKAALGPKADAKPVAVPAQPDNANDAAIIRALEGAAQDRPGEFIKVADLYARAKLAGYTNGEPALRFRMKLATNPLAKQRADIIEEQASPLAWKLRDPKPDGGDKIDQPDADDKAPVAPEPAPDAKPEPVKLYGRLAPADRLKRDRLLLAALGDEGRTFSEWSREITARGGDMGPNPSHFIEAAQQRMKVGYTGKDGPSRHGLSVKDGYITRNHFGGGATFYAYPSLKEALAKLEASK
nr:hypothetical protein GCM10017606_00390 [Microbacterium terregens]